MTHGLKKIMGYITTLFAAKSVVVTVSASALEAAMRRALHSPDECQKVTQAHLAKFRASEF